ncbi:MAG: hypothetical protein ACTHJR_10590 [Sphingomonas sp.]|uniref:hypothetical protein n=1 Tax=Sphingomonas sp. TaxID=28214 RepID=UPI003F7EF061
MKPVMFVVVAPLALAACNPTNPFASANSSSGNASAAVAVVPDAVIVNGVTYVRAGGPAPTVAPSASPTTSANILPSVAPTSPPPATPDDTSTPPPSDNPDGVVVTGGH